MNIKIEINCDNEAFGDGASGAEVARILDRIAGRIGGIDLADETGFNLFDANGNKVGKFNAWAD